MKEDRTAMILAARGVSSAIQRSKMTEKQIQVHGLGETTSLIRNFFRKRSLSRPLSEVRIWELIGPAVPSMFMGGSPAHTNL